MKDVYVITGATGGMGLSIALDFNKKARLVLVDLEEEKLIRLQQKLLKKDIYAVIISADITNDKDIKKIVNTVKQLGKFKTMIHTAGISDTMGTPKRVLEVNLLGTQKLMNAFYEIANNSIFINISSMTAYLVPDSFLYNKTLLDPLHRNFFKKMSLYIKKPNAAYAFSKKGVSLITEKAVGKWATKNSRILAISPGAVETPLLRAESSNSNSIDLLISKTPVKRAAEPKEISNLVYHVIDNEFINGADILIDGGITSYMKYYDIFGLKENKVKLFDIICLYLVVFYLLPNAIKLYDINLFNNVINDLYYLVFPVVTALITIFYNKKKFSYALALAPVIIFEVSNLVLFKEQMLKYSLIYLTIAALISLIITKLTVKKSK